MPDVDKTGWCYPCATGRHERCMGFVGSPVIDHPDSLPLCMCPHRGTVPNA